MTRFGGLIRRIFVTLQPAPNQYLEPGSDAVAHLPIDGRGFTLLFGNFDGYFL
jgi:hypothetical protein